MYVKKIHHPRPSLNPQNDSDLHDALELDLENEQINEMDNDLEILDLENLDIDNELDCLENIENLSFDDLERLQLEILELELLELCELEENYDEYDMDCAHEVVDNFCDGMQDNDHYGDIGRLDEIDNENCDFNDEYF